MIRSRYTSSKYVIKTSLGLTFFYEKLEFENENNNDGLLAKKKKRTENKHEEEDDFPSNISATNKATLVKLGVKEKQRKRERVDLGFDLLGNLEYPRIGANPGRIPQVEPGRCL